MSIRGVGDFSDKYREYGDKVLRDCNAVLSNAGIVVYPKDNSVSDGNVDSVVIKTKQETSNSAAKNKKKGGKPKVDISWIRESLPTSYDPMSLSSTVSNDGQIYLSSTASKIMNQNDGDTDSEDDDGTTYDSYDLEDIENSVTNVGTMANANDDQGDGSPLQTLFEKTVPSGFHSNNFAGTNYEKSYLEGSSEQNINVYSDNSYSNGNTSVIGGGTIKVCYNNTGSEYTKQIDYNAFAFGKYKAKKYTYGLGAINTGKNGVYDTKIYLGAMHNASNIYGIMQKNITQIPGMPVQTSTDINIGIGQASGMLDMASYDPKDSSIENISDVDQESYVTGNESGLFDDVIDDESKKSGSNLFSLVISDTDTTKECGFKFGRIFRKNKGENRSFAMPYGQLSNICVNSNEGAKLILGAKAGQIFNTNGWTLTSNGVGEVSRRVITGSRPSDYLLANVNFKAQKNKFSATVSGGCCYSNDNTHCIYGQGQLSYDATSSIKAYLKGGVADYNYDKDKTIYQIAAGVHYTF